jgi:hypothetical protein
MAVMASTGLLNAMAGEESVRDIFGPCELRIFGVSGTTPPSDPDSAEVGQLLLRLTRTGDTTKVAQVMRITPTPGTAAGADWSVTVNGDTVVFTDDGTPTAAEICTGLTALLNALAGGAMTTPAGKIQTEKCNGKFTVTNNGTTIDITSAVAGVPIDVSSAVAAGTGSLGTATNVTTTQTADAYGLLFEKYADVASGILELMAGMVPTGTGLATGTAVYGRLVSIDDDGTQSTTQPRIQGSVGVSNADILLTHTDITTGEPSTASLGQIVFNKS